MQYRSACLVCTWAKKSPVSKCDQYSLQSLGHELRDRVCLWVAARVCSCGRSAHARRRVCADRWHTASTDTLPGGKARDNVFRFGKVAFSDCFYRCRWQPGTSKTAFCCNRPVNHLKPSQPKY